MLAAGQKSQGAQVAVVLPSAEVKDHPFLRELLLADIPVTRTGSHSWLSR
jgi:hypothetical protein